MSVRKKFNYGGAAVKRQAEELNKLAGKYAT